ncbi:MAG: class I SAM-dependent methyltransferase [Eubacterium sp.]|nr:class I SAM-dependent methyltransferase [Eubacterium sp.]
MEIELDRLRANLVRAFAIPSDASILEAGGGYGAITGVLAARGRHVTVWDTSAKRCRIIARKNAGRENLSLYSGDFYAFCEEIRADRDRSGSGFDFITCIGPMQNADRICQGASSCAEIFRLLLSLLNQTGSMLILLQDIREYRALTSWIRHFGLKESVYYVSPDADYPLEISSERWLSERHSQDSYSGIKNGREAVLLLLTRTQESRAGLLYAKFSNERAAEYALYTSVCQENFSDSMQQKVKLTDSAQTERYVEKTALTEEGQAHVQRIFTLYGKLSEMYNGRLLINRCEQTDNRCSVRFAYLQGETYETYLDRILLEQGPDACEKALSDYMEMVVPKQLEVPFTETDEYTEIFGDLPDAWKNGSLRTLPISDLDLIPANVIRSENGNTLIDYEWTFEFPVPSDFLRYRILFYYLRGRDIRKGLDQERIYKKIGIDVKKREYFASMEDSFQRWITRDMVPVRDLLKESNAATQESNPEPVRNLRVYFSNSGDAAFSEDNSEEYPMEDGRISMEITLPGTVKYVRLDPGDYPGILRINQLCIDGKPPVLIRTNGVPVLQDIKTNEIKIGQISSGHAQNILDVFFSIEDPYVVICRSDRTQANRYSDYTLMLDLCFQEERPDYLQPLADYQKQRQTRDTGIMRSLCSFRLRMKNRKEHAFK